MRFFQQYRFPVGRKIEFKDLFSVIDAFLTEQNLHYGSLGYDLSSTELLQKLTKQFPQLGEPELIENRYSATYCLSNLRSAPGIKDETVIRYIGTHIPRPYNFTDTHFYYLDVTFFDKKPDCRQIGLMPNPAYLDMAGSYIELFRTFAGPQPTVVYLSAEVTDQASSVRADAYAQALSAHLGGVKYLGVSRIYLDALEKARYADLQQQVAPIVSEARENLYSRGEDMREQMQRIFLTFEQRKFSIAKSLKKTGMEHGFLDYRCLSNSLYLLCKRVDGGNFLRIELTRDPGQGVDALMILSGPGFSYEFPAFFGAPENQQEADRFLERLFEITDYFEVRYMHRILDVYPAVPEWCPECL